ncbi:MAG: 30S ribosomal protein S16 [Candidatus Falkowbacteria bacterium]
MLTIRLSRIGKRKKPMYRLIISEKSRDPYGRSLEILGSYNPFTKELQAHKERIEYWLSKGSGMSPTVNNLLIDKGLITGKKVIASGSGKKAAEAARAAAKEASKPVAEVKTEDKPEEKTEIAENKS